MFEAWLSDLLVPYLGHFLDVAPDRLRVSLFSGEGGGGEGEGGGERARGTQHGAARMSPPPHPPPARPLVAGCVRQDRRPT